MCRYQAAQFLFRRKMSLVQPQYGRVFASS